MRSEVFVKFIYDHLEAWPHSRPSFCNAFVAFLLLAEFSTVAEGVESVAQMFFIYTSSSESRPPSLKEKYQNKNIKWGGVN